MDAATALALVRMKFFDQLKDFLVIVIVIVLNAALDLDRKHCAETTAPSRKFRMPG